MSNIFLGDISNLQFKVGSSDCKIYLGDTLLYPQSPTPPTPQTLQWVTFSNGDTIPSDLDIYGVSGNAFDISSSFAYNSECFFTPDRNRIDVEFWCNGHICYSDNPLYNDTLEYIFSNLGCCDSYKIGGTASGGGIQLYVYA